MSFAQTLAILATVLWSVILQAQPVNLSIADKTATAKPYRIQTSGRQITIKSNKDIKRIKMSIVPVTVFASRYGKRSSFFVYN
jgi:hypothetical protein